jgi:hypothetical protein
MLLGSYLFINLLIGVVNNSFSKMKARADLGGCFVTEVKNLLQCVYNEHYSSNTTTTAHHSCC